jgi:dolichyl-phosphate-mannose--protein O-mannosyl transferase
MNDIFITTFAIFTLTYFYKFLQSKKFSISNLALTGLFLGLAISTKHSAILLYPIMFIFYVPNFFASKKKLNYFSYSALLLLVLPLSVYLLSYLQFFLQGHPFEMFIELQKQIFQYQANLGATHDYATAAWQWPIMARPVWFYVNYLQDQVALIYNIGNPIIIWGGLASVLFASKKFIKDKAYLFAAYLLFFLPFVFSPRIMFFHHYLPSLPYLCLIIALSIAGNKHLTRRFLILAGICFAFFYPINTAIPISKDLIDYWFWFPSWK